MSEEDFEVLEPKDYAPSKDEVYSHSTLVMSALKKAMENRSKEMRDGYENIKFDRLGNAHKVIVLDSRQEFIESVEALMMIQERDYDSKMKEELEKIEKELKEKHEDYCEKEKKHWEELDYNIVRKYNFNETFYMEGWLSKNYLPYDKMYIRDQVNSYTKIVSLIQQLIKRLGEYKKEITET